MSDNKKANEGLREEAISRLKKVGASLQPVKAYMHDPDRLIECHLFGVFSFDHEGFTVRSPQGMLKLDPDGIDSCEINEELAQLRKDFSVLDMQTGVSFARILCDSGIRVELTRTVEEL
ncbi:MAG: hypothetical protein WB421_16160 [Terriglobales bacterium]|jgi:hypothetical protein